MALEPTKSDLFITQYYEFAYNRRPDTLGDYFWVNASDNGVSSQAIASAFVSSPEFIAQYGLLTNAQFVDTLQANWGGQFTAAQINGWVSQLNSGAIDRGTALYQMVDTAGIPAADARFIFFGDSGTARSGGNQFYYQNGGATQHAIGTFFRTDGTFYGVTDIAELGDCAYSAGSSTAYDDSVGSDYNQFMYPYPSPYYLKAPYTTTANYDNRTLETSLDKNYPATDIAINGNKVWPYNIYNYPVGYPNPETGGLGGSTDGQNHFWPTPGNHDYGARAGYTDPNNTASNYDTAYPVGLMSTATPSPYIDYFAFLRDTSLLKSQAKSINIGSVDDTGNKGIYYSVTLGDQGNGKPLIELFSIDTERLNLNAGVSNEFADGYNGDDQVKPNPDANYFYDPSKPYNPNDPNTKALLTSDPANGQAQFNWLKTELQNSEATWKIIYGHQPIYNTGKMGNTVGGDHASNPVLQNFLKQLVDGTGVNFDAWVNGHTHLYERVLEQNDAGIGLGIPFITNGNSGRGLYQTYQVDYGQSLYAPKNIPQNVYLNDTPNLLPSDPVMAGVSAQLRNFTYDYKTKEQTWDVNGVGPDLPGTYGSGDGAVATAADKSYLFFDYVQTDTLDPAILANLNVTTRSKGLNGWDGLTAIDWTPTSPAATDTAMLNIVVNKDGSVKSVAVNSKGAGYMSAHGGNATVDFEIRGNDSLDASKAVNPNNYAIATLVFRDGHLDSATLKDAGAGYLYAAQAQISVKKKVYATLAPTTEDLDASPLQLPLNISVYAGTYNLKPDTQYEDWYLITDTKADVALKVNGAINATVTITPQSQAATEIIQTHDLTTGYSGIGQQQKFLAAQNGKITISDAISGSVLGSGTLINGVANFNLSALPTSKEMKVAFSGDPTSSYQINFKASDTLIATDQATATSLGVPMATFVDPHATVDVTGLIVNAGYHLA